MFKPGRSSRSVRDVFTVTVPISALQHQPHCGFTWSCSDSPGLRFCAFGVLSRSSDRQLLWVSHSCGLLIRTWESWVSALARPRVLSALVHLPVGHSERSQDLISGFQYELFPPTRDQSPYLLPWKVLATQEPQSFSQNKPSFSSACTATGTV